MLSSFLETRPGRPQEFFKLLRYCALVTIGPALAISYQWLDENDDILQQSALTAMAICSEATVESLISFIDTIRFLHLWRTRRKPRTYSRRLRGINLSHHIVPTHDTDSSVQVIRCCTYVGIAFLSLLIAASVNIPVVVFLNNEPQTEAQKWMNAICLFILIIIASGGNVFAAAFFTIERALVQGWVVVDIMLFQIAVPALLGLLLILASVSIICRIWVHTSSNAALRALANIYLFHVSTDLAVRAEEEHLGHIDAGPIYANLRDECGVARISISTIRTTEKVSLNQISEVA